MLFYNFTRVNKYSCVTKQNFRLSCRHGLIYTRFYKYAIATNDFENLSIEWQGNNTYVQSAAVVTDYGVFESPDAFFKDHSQHWSKVKNYLYVHLGRKMMNQNVSNIRKQYVSKCSRWNNGDN